MKTAREWTEMAAEQAMTSTEKSPAAASPIASCHVRTLNDILNGQIVPPKWIIRGLLLGDSALLTSGHPHAGKSLNWLCAAMESVSTRKVWGHFPSPDVRRVLYIETEDPPMVVEQRVRELSKGLGISPEAPPDGFFLACTGPFDLAKCEGELNALIDRYQPDWIVLSTLQGLLVNRDWSSQKDMSEINAIIVRLSRRCPLVLVTHSTWDARNKRAAGSITQAANFLTTVHFEKTTTAKGETRTKVKVDCKLGQEEPEFDLVLETAPVPGEQRTELRRVKYAGEHVKSDKELIKEYVAENPDATPTDVAREVGCTYEYARRTMKAPAPEPVPFDPNEGMGAPPSKPVVNAVSTKRNATSKAN